MSDRSVHQFSRRQVLAAGSAALVSGVGLAGCSKSKDEESESGEAEFEFSDVPLRVMLWGSQADQDAIARAWTSISPQALEFTLIEESRTGTDTIDRLIEASEKQDVLIYPLMAVTELEGKGRIYDLAESEVKLAEQSGGVFLASLRNGVMRHGSSIVGLPLGGRQPSVISADEAASPATWQEYDQWGESLSGAVAEPLADGWAGTMFLWRAASTLSRGWLFGLQNFEPKIADQPFVDVLTQMRTTVQRSPVEPSNPHQIWEALGDGRLKGAIGFSSGDVTTDQDYSFAAIPATSLPKVVLDPYSLVASLADRCRQSDVSKLFVRWLAGGEGSELARREVAAMTLNRRTGGGDGAADVGYASVVREALAVSNVLPTIKMNAADQYYVALDEAVLCCVSGDAEPAAALEGVRDRWAAISREVGLEKQQRAWRMAQGMSG